MIRRGLDHGVPNGIPFWDFVSRNVRQLKFNPTPVFYTGSEHTTSTSMTEELVSFPV
uniref:Uncharacterized protein n=1 Tax=Zymomonas mobilis subsp. mobilis str. CP4 = NRRL B-14023 TaxID=627343 RepID=B3GN85_ZYMMB|nr:hypothetical protein [Zymomonas mobilis subsp. mobilis str. CP4 = NRRL B-14023]